MKDFPKTQAETRALALLLVEHLRLNLRDTHGQEEWTTHNLELLRSFQAGYDIQHFPAGPSNQLGAFLWDYIAYQQDTGILIAAETEHNNHHSKLKEDFEKLLYVRSPIKIFFFRTSKDSEAAEQIVTELHKYMSCCSKYSASEVFVLYGRIWQNDDGSNGDRAWLLQVPGEPAHVSLADIRFTELGAA